MIKKIVIFGSCVSRDPFHETVREYTGLTVVDYFARTSFASLSGNSVEAADLSRIQSPFQRRMVERDFNKKFLDFDFNEVDAVIFDFIDDRFPLLKLDCGGCCTESEEFKKMELQLDAKIIQPFSDDFFERWASGWGKLKSVMKELDAFDKILVNKVFLADVDDAGCIFQQKNYISTMNSWLSRVYEFLSSELSGDHFIKYNAGDFVAQSNHKWGRSPFHFNDLVNNNFISCVEDFCVSRHLNDN